MAADPAADLAVERTPIPGLLVVRLPVHGDNRGWFKENWQRAKMVALGLPDFEPVQNNVSFNAARGTTRGIHAEPWDKYVSVATGRIFGAWVDLREGDTFGTAFTCEVDEHTAVFVPRGVGNAFQTLTDDTAYSYLVNDHWTSSGEYSFLNLADETVAIDWPIALAEAEMSDKDRAHPRLADATPVPRRKTLVLGADGQLGKALRAVLPGAEAVGRDRLDLSDPAALAAWPWSEYDTVINAAAYTKVDEAETPQGRLDAWRVNAAAVAALVEQVRHHRSTLVHVSTDYVFDGTAEVHREDEPLSPLGVYGQSKAAGDLAVATYPRHYLVRTSWVIGEGKNFVATMESLADRGISPSVVGDQHGRLTHTDNLAAAIVHLLQSNATYGTYNVTDGGRPTTWAEIAKAVFVRRGRDPGDVESVDSETYFAGKTAAPRPMFSVLDLSKITATGYHVPTFSEGS